MNNLRVRLDLRGPRSSRFAGRTTPCRDKGQDRGGCEQVDADPKVNGRAQGCNRTTDLGLLEASVESGFDAFKIKLGAGEVAAEVATVATVRKLIGPSAS